MLCWVLVFLGTAFVAALRLGGIASTAAGIAQVLFFVFLVAFLVALVMGLVRHRPPIRTGDPEEAPEGEMAAPAAADRRFIARIPRAAPDGRGGARPRRAA
jgi:uncharacterized membrane protein YtjA (UPF0391 family)